MLKCIYVFLILILLNTSLYAGSLTDNLDLYKPDYNESGDTWWSKINDNFDILDDTVGAVISTKDPLYGAICDGTTNDAVAIQAILDEAASSGRSIIVSGTCAVGSTGWVGFLLSAKTNITIKAAHEGAGFKLLVAPSQTLTNHGAISKSIFKLLNSSFIRFEGLKFNMNDITGCGIGMEGTTDSTFEGNYFLNATGVESAGIISENGSRNKYLNNRLLNCYGGFNLGYQATGMAEKYAQISHNIYRDTATGSGTIAFGSYLQYSEIDNNIAIEPRAVGVYLAGGTSEQSLYNDVHDNIVIGSTLSAFETLTSSTALLKHNSIHDNWAIGSDSWGYYLVGFSDGDVINNKAIDCGNGTTSGGLIISALATTGAGLNNLKINNNRAYDTRSGGSREMFYGIRFDNKTFDATNIEMSGNYGSNTLDNIITVSSSNTSSDLTMISNQAFDGVKNGIKVNGIWDGGVFANNNAKNNNTGSGGDLDIMIDGAATAGTWKLYGNKTGSGMFYLDTLNIIDGFLVRNASAVETSGTGEDTLRTSSIPANIMGTKGGLKITASGYKAGGAGNKTLKFYFGTTSVTFNVAANNTNKWRFEAHIFNTDATHQRIEWVGFDGATPLVGSDAADQNTAAAVTTKITGECADGADTIGQTVWIIEATDGLYQ